ncbi:MAG TPA: ABC transporter permease [Flavisolibacter sp.]
MNKTLLVIQREFLTRVRKKTFIISTILFPLLYLGLIFGTTYFAEKSSKNLRIALIDSSGYFNKALVAQANQQDGSSYLDYISLNADSVVKNFSEMGYDGYAIIPASNWETGIKTVTLKAGKTYGEGPVMKVQSKLNTIWARVKAEKLGIDDRKSAILNSNITVEAVNVNDEKSNAKIASIIGYTCGFLIYFIMLIYGSQVMMGVMEEKTNRIAEVMVSSIRPFQLMLGKIVGIGLVALTQFILWIGFIFLVYNLTASTAKAGAMSGIVGELQNVFTSINLSLILFCFAFYLLGGFFFYSSLYAAIGSAVNEDMREAQSLSFPVTILVIFSIILLPSAMADPTGDLAFWGSMIPFSSPIIMMARIPFGVPGTVPWWELGLSMVLLVAGFIFSTWFAGKIYRTGILMYGKKASWGEMLKWVVRKS